MKVREALSAALMTALFASVGAAEGFGILNAYEPAEGVVFGGQLTEEQLAALAAASFKSIIDLRGEDEDRGYDEAAAVQHLGLEYLPLPVTEAIALLSSSPRPRSLSWCTVRVAIAWAPSTMPISWLRTG